MDYPFENGIELTFTYRAKENITMLWIIVAVVMVWPSAYYLAGNITVFYQCCHFRKRVSGGGNTARKYGCYSF